LEETAKEAIEQWTSAKVKIEEKKAASAAKKAARKKEFKAKRDAKKMSPNQKLVLLPKNSSQLNQNHQNKLLPNHKNPKLIIKTLMTEYSPRVIQPNFWSIVPV